MHRPTLMLAAVAVALGGAAAPQIMPKTQLTPQPRLTPKPLLTPAAACRVDPAIAWVTLTKAGGSKERIIVAFEVVNQGRSAWSSGAGQQNVSLVVRNGSTGRQFSVTRPLPERAAAGGRMLAYTSPIIPSAFDTFEFGGTVDIQIGYDPDIAIDARPCNNDANASNNRKQITAREINGFLNTAATTQRF
ncbi:hypothetical protein [Sphingomonas koreensis]